MKKVWPLKIISNFIPQGMNKSTVSSWCRQVFNRSLWIPFSLLQSPRGLSQRWSGSCTRSRLPCAGIIGRGGGKVRYHSRFLRVILAQGPCYLYLSSLWFAICLLCGERGRVVDEPTHRGLHQDELPMQWGKCWYHSRFCVSSLRRSHAISIFFGECVVYWYSIQ